MKSASATSTVVPCVHTDQPQPLRKRRFARLLERLFASCGVTARLRLVLFVLFVPPPAIMLYLLESKRIHAPEEVVAFWLALALISIKPVSTLTARWVALGELATINAFCAALRRGEYTTRLTLPPQGDDEHAVLQLKRDLNWLAHHIETRETWLRAMLDDTRERERHYKDLSLTDPLTGLCNRRRFTAVLDELIRTSALRRTPFTLLCIDCDAFKRINDRYGHQAGDTTLIALAQALRVNVRECFDQAFRLGGDEFAVVLPHLASEAALNVANRIRRSFATANSYGGTVSIGVACLDPSIDGPAAAASVVSRCDAALYRAKARGGDQTVLAERHDSPCQQPSLPLSKGGNHA